MLPTRQKIASCLQWPLLTEQVTVASVPYLCSDQKTAYSSVFIDFLFVELFAESELVVL